MPIRLSIVVAAAESVIGSNGRLPWRQSSDLKRFRALTLGKPVIMGRKTFDGLPKALDGRDNIVITRDPDWSADGAISAPGLDAAIAVATEYAGLRGVEEIMVIGGAEVYRAAQPRADRIYLTRIHASPAGDTIFPIWTRRTGGKSTARTSQKAPATISPATLCVFERTRGRKLAPR